MAVTTSNVGTLLHIRIDNPPVNAISRAVRQELLDAVETLNKSDAVGALLCGAGRTFIAGADIREMGQPDNGPQLPEVMQVFRTSGKPIVACLHGTPRGGGLELAMACQYRVALRSTTLGLPEVAIGLVPGSGGTQCLPRLVDTAFAIDMITQAKAVDADSAAEHGLLDAVFDGNDTEALLAAAEPWLLPLMDQPHPVIADTPAQNTLSEAEWQEITAHLKQKSRGQIAPLAALELIRTATRVPLTQGLEQEREVFVQMRDSSESRALRHLFFAERAVAKPRALGDSNTQPDPVQQVGVIGGGLMGSGIATAALNADYPVTLVEQSPEAAERARDTIKNNLDAAVKRNLLSSEKAEKRLQQLSCVTGYSSVSECDLVIEAVFEDMAVKKDVFAELDRHTRPGTILASNTSYLDINEIAQSTTRPVEVVGLHFFSPAHIMKLLEIVRTEHTETSVLQRAFAFAKKLRKTAVLVGVCDGFVGNRILRAYRFQAETLLEEGCLPEQVDAAVTALGFPMGPFQMQDLAGLDIGWAMRKRQAPHRPADEHYVTIADQLCELGRFGQKSGAGWYRYESGSRQPVPDPEVTTIVRNSGDPAQKRTIDNKEIQQRILAVMANEGALIVGENIAERPLDIDVVMVNGYGFPRHLGGPMQYADEHGLVELQTTLEKIARHYPNNVRIAPLLRSLIEQQQDFNSLN